MNPKIISDVSAPQNSSAPTNSAQDFSASASAQGFSAPQNSATSAQSAVFSDVRDLPLPPENPNFPQFQTQNPTNNLQNIAQKSTISAQNQPQNFMNSAQKNTSQISNQTQNDKNFAENIFSNSAQNPTNNLQNPPNFSAENSDILRARAEIAEIHQNQTSQIHQPNNSPNLAQSHQQNLANLPNLAPNSANQTQNDKNLAQNPQISKTIPDAPLVKSPIETPRPNARNKFKRLKDRIPPKARDFLGLLVFVAVVFFASLFFNAFIFKSFSVIGPSMEPTLDGGASGSVVGAPSDRLMVNMFAKSWAGLTGGVWTPARGEIVVFKNPVHQEVEGQDEFVVKRVVGLPGERVVVKDCKLKIYNAENPNGFDPYPTFKNFAENDKEINPCVDGDVDETVPDGRIFVVGDHRTGSWSMDSRNLCAGQELDQTTGGCGRATLGTIPLENLVGTATLRIWPLNKMKIF